jgi:hypothetical protein
LASGAAQSSSAVTVLLPSAGYAGTAAIGAAAAPTGSVVVVPGGDGGPALAFPVAAVAALAAAVPTDPALAACTALAADTGVAPVPLRWADVVAAVRPDAANAWVNDAALSAAARALRALALPAEPIGVLPAGAAGAGGGATLAPGAVELPQLWADDIKTLRCGSYAS